MRRLTAILAGAVLAATPLAAGAETPNASDWDAVVKAADGQTVYFNAWGGSQNINDYIEWVAGEVKERYGVTLDHVKLDDTANAVAQVVAEKAAGKDEDGGIDLIWINGENFVSMQEQSLLSDGFATKLPNWRYVDTDNPSVTTDFTQPTNGQESPWGGAKLVFFTDPAKFGSLDTMPDSADELLEWAKAHPGRFSYPAPPDFIGSSFLKQILIETTADPSVLQKPVDEANFAEVTAPLWAYLDQLDPVLWRSGRDYPQNYPAMKQLLADGELGIIFAFNPAEASSGIANGEMPDTVRSFTFSGGTLGNTHFVAIPYNSGSKEGAMVVANFLISPEAQLRKEDPAIWGDPTVLAMNKLPAEDRAAFEAIDRGVATLAPGELGPVLPEPHASWMTRIEEEWLKRYGS
ncbi:putative thiamine transport system substrate-binding protein [Fulvimarina manganoxydans]|uniref:Putative thiamine transport system substrate-binding protein n=1 Tax=Fulvimarina manganoxydans TaxID=937218 RepID=A0A1W1YEJ4_9HYPH|nr:ABC transporter substrate-binding protein [Fulvimarina manganoxydans]SMC34587.1 putative thiamine transport system substrate-binding protein [Fulvimarina manganoxydans]